MGRPKKKDKAEKAMERRIKAGNPKLTPKQVRLLRALNTLMGAPWEDKERLMECGLIQSQYDTAPTVTKDGETYLKAIDSTE